MALRSPDSTLGPFRERDTPVLRATVVDNSVPAVPIPGASLDTMTLTLYNERPTAGVYTIINSRDHVDIKANVNGAGEVAFQFVQADMAILDTTKSEEYHRCLIEWTWNTTQRGSWEIRIIVQNVNKVPA
jgi:hypothetical protein